MEFEHEKFGKCVVSELTQKQLEDFQIDVKGLLNEPLSVWRGMTVRSAIKRGFLVEPAWKVEDVDTAKPSQIIWISNCITKVVAEVTRVDPLS
jgi:rRNA processing protein Krr1/Pno1